MAQAPREGWDPRYCTREFYDYMVAQAPEGAILANLWAHAPHNSYGPPYWYVDEWRECRDCRCEFRVSAEEQRHWYETLKIPIYVRIDRCPTCRRLRRETRREQAHQAGGGQASAEPGAAPDLGGGK